jgi:protein TonB
MQNPTPHPLLAAPRSDGKILRISFLFALAVHLMVLVIPLNNELAILDLPPEIEPIAVTSYIFDPPELPERTVREIRTEPRRVPVPATDPEPEMLEPVDETVSPDLPVPLFEEGELLLPDDVRPPEKIVHESWERDLMLPVRLPGSPDPEYPEMGRVSRLGGTVVLQAVIDRSGQVAEVELLRAPVPDTGFSKAAIRAVSSWRYRPGTLNGRPVAVRMSVVVEFSLQ